MLLLQWTLLPKVCLYTFPKVFCRRLRQFHLQSSQKAIHPHAADSPISVWQLGIIENNSSFSSPRRKRYTTVSRVQKGLCSLWQIRRKQQEMFTVSFQSLLWPRLSKGRLEIPQEICLSTNDIPRICRENEKYGANDEFLCVKVNEDF